MPKAKKTAAKSKTTKALSKSKFIREQPASMSAKDVVKKGKGVGLTLTEKYVWNVRSAAKTAKKGKLAPAMKAAPAPKVPVAAKAKPGKKATKSAYVLSFPPGTPAADVVAAGAAKGIKLSTAHVYAIRTANKAKAKKAGKTVKASKPATKITVAKPAFRDVPRTGSLEEQFVSLVLDIGLARAGELLGKLKERVQKLAL